MSDYKIYHDLYGIPRSVRNEALEARSNSGEYYIRRKSRNPLKWLVSLFS